MTTWVTPLYGALKGRMLKVVRVERRPRNTHGDLVLCETALGRRHWLRRQKVARATRSGIRC